MGPLSRWAVNRPWPALGVWVLLAVLIGVAGARLGGSYNDSFDLPDTESAAAQELLGQIPGVEDSLNEATVKVVWSPDSGAATDPEPQAVATELLTELAGNPSVSCIVTPYGGPLGEQCPDPAGQAPVGAGQDPTAEGAADDGGQSAGDEAPAPSPEQLKVLAAAGPAGVSVDGAVAYATLTFGAPAGEIPVDDVLGVLEAVEAANGEAGLQVGAAGFALDAAGAEPPSSEAIGVAVALLILLIAFGSLIGALLPIGTALLSLGLGQALVLVTANYFTVATFAPTVAAMIGLGVGIDYSLFVINRYRQALQAGRDPRPAALEAVRTAGRAVVFAAATVIIALSGLFVIGFDFFNGLAVAAIATVVMMMIGATFLLPAILSLLGRRAFSVRIPGLPKPLEATTGVSGFARYGNWLQGTYRVVGAIALLVLVVVAVPVASMRMGFPDDGGRPDGSAPRIAFDLTAEGFGPGVNGPVLVTAQTVEAGDNAAVGQLAGGLSADPGVAAAIPIPMSAEATVTAVQVIPTTAPQAAETEELLERMRSEIVPSVEAATGLTAYVGGTLAITSDFTTVLSDALPLFLAVVIGFGFLALMLLFRSILVPLTGVATSLLSLAAAMGLTVAVFQWGWAADIVGVTSTGPILPFLPIMVFAILFGLSMDYHVFLVSRMQEEWGHTANNDKAVRRGLAASGRVVMIAGAIMISVFAAFVLGNDSTIKLFGLALSSAILFDAFVVRLIIVPSVMYQLGRANWWLPQWLGRILPRFAVESEEDVAAEGAEIHDIPEAETGAPVA